MYRHPRYKGDQIIEASGTNPRENARVLAAIPYWSGEAPVGIMATVSAITTAGKTARRPADFNFKVISVPWAMALTHKAFGGGTTAYEALQNADAIHDLYEDLIYDNEDDGVAYFGHRENDLQTEEEAGKTPGEVPIIHYGPSVVGIHMSVETMLFPEMVEGENKVKYSWGFQGPIPIKGVHPGGGIILIGAHRFHLFDNQSFDIQLSNAERMEAVAQLVAGTWSLVQQRISTDTSSGADYIRQSLFAGDEATEADNWNDSDIQVNLKAHAIIQTPAQRVRI